MAFFRPRPFRLATVLFFLSGALGLGYELVWIRKAILVVGASQIALATVLTAFFLGLGIGSYFVGRHLQSSRWSPLFLYGLFEIAIGIFALAFPWLFDFLEVTYAALYPFAAGSNAALFALRFLLLFVLCLIPTFFMGGTLPLLLDGLVKQDRSIGSHTSFLYGINILGAVAGVLVTCYFAIPMLGMNSTSVAGGFGNLLIGGFALSAFCRLKPVHTRIEHTRLDLFYPLAAFASGSLAIAYQICWARYFSLFNTGNVYLTAILLAVFLLALAAGSFVLAPLLQARFNPLRILGFSQALIPPLALFTLEAWRLAEHRFALKGEEVGNAVVPVKTLEIDPEYQYFLQIFGETVDSILVAPLLQVLLVIFLPVALIGVGLPALIAAATQRSTELRSVSGRVVFWNTLGSSAGGFLAGYALLPFIGLHWSLFTLAMGSLCLSVAALAKSSSLAASPAIQSRPPKKARRPAVKPVAQSFFYAVPALALIAVILFITKHEDISAYTMKYHGYGRDLGYDPDRTGESTGLMPLVKVIDGPFNSSFVFEDADTICLGSGNVCLAVVYKKGFSTQTLQGHIPCLFYPGKGDPKDCLGICLGSGQSFGSLLLYPIERLDVVDISKEITALALQYFEPYIHDLEQDERVAFHLDDGRHFVTRAPASSYDIISMEPPPPAEEGVYSLYSDEFYRQVSRVLRDTGVFMQWLPLYRITPLDAKGIIKTQAAVFPETFVIKVGYSDFMVVSYKVPPKFDLARMRDRCKILAQEPRVKGVKWNSRCQHEISTLEGVLALIIMGPQDIRDMEAPMIYHDDTQMLSYSSGDRQLLRRYEGPALANISFTALRTTPYTGIKDYFDPPLSTAQMVDLSNQRAASLANFQVPEPQRLGALLRTFNQSTSAREKATSALAIAAALDNVLAKKDAFKFLDEALAAMPRQSRFATPENLALVRKIVRNTLAVYEELTGKWLATFGENYPDSLLVKAMRQEFQTFQQREEKRLSNYLFR